MKKTTTVVQEKNIYNIGIMINNIALINSVTGKSGLLNVKTNEIIGVMDNYETKYNSKSKFYYQIKKVKSPDNANELELIRIYDAKEERMIVDGWEVVKKFSNYHFSALKSPLDGKIHLFNEYECRNISNMFALALDDVEILFESYNDYLVLIQNGKKALFYFNDYDKIYNLETAFEFDDIEVLPKILVFTQGSTKYFKYINKKEERSPLFDDITVDEEYKNIIYCKKGDDTYIYNTYIKKLLLKTDIKTKYLTRSSDNDFYNSFFFQIEKNSKLGLTMVETNEKPQDNVPKIQTITLLEPLYDDIYLKNHYGRVYLELNQKQGLFLFRGNSSQLINPSYHKIQYLGWDIYALYPEDNEYCDLVQITPYSPSEELVTNCRVIQNHERGIVYEKNNLFGLIIKYNSFKIIPALYSKISPLSYYFLAEKEDKKGLILQSEFIIPLEYKDIEINTTKTDSIYGPKAHYFALQKDEGIYELAKRENRYNSSEVEFVSNHQFKNITFFDDIMVLQDEENTFIYNYEEKLLKTFPSSVTIIPEIIDANTSRAKYFYIIDGITYYYKNAKFEQAPCEENTFYLTTYETDEAIYEVKSWNKEQHDIFCGLIDNDDEKAKNCLLNAPLKETCTPYNFPTLTLKRTLKKDN